MKEKIVSIIQFIGTPVLAVGIGLLITIYGLTRNLDKQRVLEEVEIGIKSAGTIILITGAGWSFWNVN